MIGVKYKIVGYSVQQVKAERIETNQFGYVVVVSDKQVMHLPAANLEFLTATNLGV